MEIKTDMYNTEIWLQSLGLLFNACKPLTYDCDRTDNEQKLLFDDIENHSYYCQSVKDDIDNGRRPKTLDEWNRKNCTVEEAVVKPIANIDIRGFSNDLTKMFE